MVSSVSTGKDPLELRAQVLIVRTYECARHLIRLRDHRREHRSDVFRRFVRGVGDAGRLLRAGGLSMSVVSTNRNCFFLS